MIKRILLLGTAGAMIVVFSVATPSQARPPHGGLCELQGTATFNSPGLKVAPNKTLGYSFQGSLTNCHEGTVKAAPPTTGSASGSINATGTAMNPGISCEGGLSKGTANATWTSGAVGGFSVAYKTASAGAVVLVEGKVKSS